MVKEVKDKKTYEEYREETVISKEELEKCVLVPIEILESVINNPANRAAIEQLRELAQKQHPEKWK